jgi:hypothetical protein
MQHDALIGMIDQGFKAFFTGLKRLLINLGLGYIANKRNVV